MTKTAVILCNLGGPDNLEAVQPFLFNLFSDRAIINLPQPMRYVIARMISKKRAPVAQEIYRQMGGKSPIVENTVAQVEALEAQLKSSGDYKVFFVMRYWHPRSDEVAKQVKKYKPDNIIFLPLYPQFSTTTTASSYKDMQKALEDQKITAPMRYICCYPSNNLFIEAYASMIEQEKKKIKDANTMRILFSAHGLPEKVVRAGDPYQWQVEKSVAAIVKRLGGNQDHVVCYQSRVGPLKWIGPSTDEEIRRAGREKKAVLLVPVAFVSEHSETLVELDIEYKHLADEAGVLQYVRVPTVSTHPLYIQALADMCIEKKTGADCASGDGTVCNNQFRQCPCAA